MTTSHPFNSERDCIDEKASTWVVLASERELSHAELEELDAWRAADPRHEKAWQDFSRTWDELPAMRSLAELVPVSAIAANDQDDAVPHRWQLRKSAWGAVAAILIAAIAIPTYVWQARPEQYATQIAQTRLIALPDGTQVTLGPRSSLEVKFNDGERRVALTGGEAFFEVVHDKGRPFFVEAGTSQVRVLGTKFDVNYSHQTVRVSVLQGLVEVRDQTRGAHGQPDTQLLRAGQRTEIALAAPDVRNATTTPGPALALLPAQSPGAWREGRMVYENARLADLVADVNRYYAPGVILKDPAIGDFRVTAAFKASEIPAFMNAVSGIVPVHAEEDPNGAFRLRAASEKSVR